VNAVPSNPGSPLRYPAAARSLALDFPRVWVGFLLAGGVFLLELSGGFLNGWAKARGEASPIAAVLAMFSTSFAVYVAGLVYWFWWVYRMHQILAQASRDRYSVKAYPITPGKAVGYQFIPFYNIYWNFKWSNRIADFVRHSSTPVPMSKGWVGFWLLLANILASLDKGLGLAVLFAISAYLARKIRRAIVIERWQTMGLRTFSAPVGGTGPAAYAAVTRGMAAAPDALPAYAQPYNSLQRREDWDLKMSTEWKLPVSSGIGAAFGFLLCYGFWFLRSALALHHNGEMLGGMFKEGGNILLVAIVLYFFLEPLADLLLEEFHVEDAHRHKKQLWQKLFRFAVFVVLVDVAHSLLERAVEEGGGAKVATVGILVTLFFGGMTYLWISGAPKRWRGALAVVGPGTALLLAIGYGAMPVLQKMEGFKGSPLGVAPLFVPFGNVAASAAQVVDEEIKRDRTAAQREKPLKQEVLASVELSQEQSSATAEAAESAEAAAEPGKASQNGADVAVVLGGAVFVALGGFAAMRRRLGRVGVAATVFTAAVLSALALQLSRAIESFYIVIALWSAFWWCLGMLAFYDHDIFQATEEVFIDPLTGEIHSGPTHEETPVREQFPHTVWLVSGAILLGLVVLAYNVHPKGDDVGAPTLDVKADNQSKDFGQPNPELTAHASGMMYQETEESVLAGKTLCTPASIDTPPGKYPIALALGAGNELEKKYTLHLVPGFLTILPASTTVSLSSNAPTAGVNSPVVFAARVTVQAPESQATPAGSVEFYADKKSLGTAAVSNGAAYFTANSLPLGTHFIEAKYFGGGNFHGSTSDHLLQQIILPYTPPVPPPPPPPNILPAGTAIMIATNLPIDSSISQANEPMMGMLAWPLSVNGHTVAERGATAILSLTDIDPAGRQSGKPALTIHLVRLEIAGKSYLINSTLRMQSPAGRVHIGAAGILTFKLQSPITLDTPISRLAPSPRAPR
jgi:hypothetical protein